ncbi:MAG: hypothetical protein E6J90_05610 [Deltaproteobacteria bacterium]|nr:MAG: hypothetical protein E6J91_22690 [Deltaproteobacteria bacterium]TMQ25655.1 MAG: hypothetical protein E6J90_05610 [Deltaproteobacteria bacterium]
MPGHRILAIAAVVLIAGIAHADPASTLKQEGLKAAKDKNWEVARERFEQSYALDPRPLTLFNLAVAQEHTDRLVEARASYTSFLDQPATAESEPFRKLARNAIPALDKAIPTLQIRATGLAAGDAIELDGRAATTDAAIALDPGSHTVVVRRAGAPVVQRSVALVRGAHDNVDLAIPVAPVPPARVEPPPEPAPRLSFERPAAPPPRERASVLRSGWFWGATAIVVLAAAGATYYYLTPPTHDPTPGTLGVLHVP